MQRVKCGGLTLPALATIIVWLLAAVPTHGQIAAAERIRGDVHDRLRAGHAPLAYSRTDEALASIHADEAQTGNVVLFYTNRSQDMERWVNRDPQDGWNREHLWPQSRGTRSVPMKTDLFHLVPTDASVNQRRGNLNFDEGGTPEGEAGDTFLDENSFEPRGGVKGDVARAIFYMDLRYEGKDGEPDLTIVKDSAPAGGTTIGNLCTLLDWHREDPVSSEERARNDATQAIQGNRNAFIDEPQLAETIYAAECSAPDMVAEANTDLPAPALRIATWNIANLHHESNIPLRESSIARDDQDYLRLAQLAESLDLDVVALQEVGSPAAVARVFPDARYHIVMSERYESGDEDKPASERDIFTAWVFAKDRFPTPPRTSTLNALSIAHIGFDRDGKPSARATRSGIVSELMVAGVPVKILGVHLKSFCHRWSLDPVVDQNASSGAPYSSRFDCRTLSAQLNLLENWLEQQADQGITTIVLGDFNRDLNAVDDGGLPIDDFWVNLNDNTPNGLRFSKGPLGKDTVCWPDHSKRFDDHIDFIIFDDGLHDLAAIEAPRKFSMGFENDPKYADRDRQRLSDHCPVVFAIQE